MRKRSKFSLSHYVLKTCKMGYVLPVGLVEVLPGDSFRHATSVFMRLAPMLAPVMHPVTVRIHHWFIPTRLLWDDFEDFITGGPTNTDVSEFPTITAPSGGFTVGSLADHLGLPPGIDGIEVSALPFRAYNLVYNEWYRDQDLETEKALSLESGPDTTTATDLLRCDWERDYFTTARPWPQKGPDVSVPVNLTAAGEPSVTATITPNGAPTFKASSGGQSISSPLKVPYFTSGTSIGSIGGSVQTTVIGSPGSSSSSLINLSWDDPKLQANINFQSGNPELGSVNINSLREAFALQRFAEHRAMYGSRYVEYLRYLGIKASDARLQRPEYLGGGKQTIQFSEVLQTAEGTDPVGTLRGHGIAAMRSNRYRRFFEEHGFVLSIMLVRPKAIYMQGIPRSWLRRVREDFFQTELQHIGQQEVYTKELYGAASDGEDGDLKVFGYQNRYDEYRGHESYVCGEFRDILDYWHLARSFSNEPVLNADFISATPSERIFAAQENDQLYCMINHSLQARRLMSKFGNPI
ncbi:major capsid protein [uncultured Desulfovibrio sp.]|uniref:major capsid protein n=1 Tax=uncultured Desulfovibrio sp. TaxID=167968 RepID=UPI002603C8D6|nr:major capsid protein [uncultured Desulfovibrio sp.]